MTSSPFRKFIEELLSERGKSTDFDDATPLFTSGLLDSLAATELMLHLEAEHGVDLADPDFDIASLDTLGDLERFVAQPA